ncbi:hypothetical protein [Gryllotalpicola koreensis]|uniref:Uncharacterized protein n=1 Tax=Gryllotalpicola koreensis TaxID=993086 RepID=A0ABP8A6N7_9MICO
MTNTAPAPTPEPITLKRASRTRIYLIAAPVGTTLLTLAAQRDLTDPHAWLAAAAAGVGTLVAATAAAHISGS